MKPSSVLLRRLGFGLALGLLLGILVFVAMRTGPLAPVQVQVVAVEKGRVAPDLFGIGQVEAQRSWLMGPTVAGRVRSVSVQVGDTVQPGQSLAEMDPVDLDQRLLALDAALARARSAQQAAQAQLADATARRALAQTNLQRNQDLARQNFISSGALEARQQELASAEAAVQAAQASLAGSAQDLIRQQAERAALASQRGSLHLLAPAAAVVTSRDAEPGSTVVAGQSVVRLIDPSSLWIRLRLDQGRSAGLAPGLAARIVLRSRPGEGFDGRVSRVEWLADSVTEERLALVSFDAVPSGISVGEMVEVRVAVPPSNEGLVLPNAAVQAYQGQAGVWRLRQDKLAFVPVRRGAQSLEGQVLVQPLQPDGLAAGDPVVLYSASALRPDVRVKVVAQLLKNAAGGGAP